MRARSGRRAALAGKLNPTVQVEPGLAGKQASVCYARTMGILHRSAASLNFYGDDLDPEELSQCLGALPDVGVRKGDAWRTRGGVEKIARTGSWRISAEDREPEDLDGQINSLLDGLADDFPAWRSFAERYRGRIFCGLFLESGNEGLALRSSTLTRLGERGLQLDFDIYSAVDW